MPTPLRLGLVGAGPWARRIAATAAAMPDTRVARVARRSGSPVSWAPEVVAGWRALISAGGLDGVVVAADPALHATIGIAAVEAGLPVLVEKPMALDVASAEALAAAARTRGVPVMVDHTHLFHPGYEILKERAGRPRRVYSTGGSYGPFRDVPSLWDYGPHDVALCLDLLGEATEVTSAIRIRGRARGEIIRIGLRNQDSTAVIHTGNGMPSRVRVLVVERADGSFLRLDELAVPQLRDGDVPLAFPPERPLEHVLRAFASAIRTGEVATSDADFGVAVVRVLAAADATLPVECRAC